MTLSHQSSEPPARRLLTISQAAEYLGCSRTNVYSLIDAGQLPVVAVGRSRGYRIDRGDLDAFIQKRKFQKADGEQAPQPPSRPRLKHIRL